MCLELNYFRNQHIVPMIDLCHVAHLNFVKRIDSRVPTIINNNNKYKKIFVIDSHSLS